MGTGTHHHDTAFSIVKALGIVAVVISHAAILTPLETFTYYFNTAVFFFVAGYFFDDGQTAAPGRFIGRKLRRLYLPYVALGTLFVLLHNRFLEWHLIAYDFSAREAILPYDTPELLRTLGRVFLFLHHEQMLAPFWFLQGLFLGLMLFFCITLATRKLAPTQAGAERLRGGSILFLFTVAMLLARHPSGIPGEWIAVRTFAITGIIYLGKLFRIFRARIPAGRAHRNALPGHPARGGSRRLPRQPRRETFRKPGVLRRAGMLRMLPARHRRKPPRGIRQPVDTYAGLYGTAHDGDHALARPRFQTGDTLSDVGLPLPASQPGLPPGHSHGVALVVDTLYPGRDCRATGFLRALRPAQTIRSTVMSGFSRSRSI